MVYIGTVYLSTVESRKPLINAQHSWRAAWTILHTKKR